MYAPSFLIFLPSFLTSPSPLYAHVLVVMTLLPCVRAYIFAKIDPAQSLKKSAYTYFTDAPYNKI